MAVWPMDPSWDGFLRTELYTGRWSSCNWYLVWDLVRKWATCVSICSPSFGSTSPDCALLSLWKMASHLESHNEILLLWLSLSCPWLPLESNEMLETSSLKRQRDWSKVVQRYYLKKPNQFSYGSQFRHGWIWVGMFGDPQVVPMPLQKIVRRRWYKDIVNKVLFKSLLDGARFRFRHLAKQIAKGGEESLCGSIGMKPKHPSYIL